MLRLTVEDYNIIVIKHTLYTAILRKVVAKVYTTIPKGIVGGFKFTVLLRNLKELVRKVVEMCL